MAMCFDMWRHARMACLTECWLVHWHSSLDMVTPESPETKVCEEHTEKTSPKKGNEGNEMSLKMPDCRGRPGARSWKTVIFHRGNGKMWKMEVYSWEHIYTWHFPASYDWPEGNCSALFGDHDPWNLRADYFLGARTKKKTWSSV